jgi:WD40 repeat protein
VVTLDAVLIGHEASITSLDWEPGVQDTGVPKLLSTSTDSSLIIWSMASASTAKTDSAATDSLWIVNDRFGDVGGQRLGGFVGGFWGSAGDQALAYGWNGSFRRWCKEPNTLNWIEVIAVTGHHGPVKGLSWSPDGDYLLSTR